MITSIKSFIYYVQKFVKQRRYVPYQIPAELAKNFITLDPQGMREIQESLYTHYFANSSEEFLNSSFGKNDVNNHLIARLNNFRRTIVPWLHEIFPLKNAKILEIGCGTGSSTVSLAEQGADVIGLDIDDNSLQVAKDRCVTYGLNHVQFMKANATEVNTIFHGQKFDFIIFFAVLEHMTHDERMVAIKAAWQLLDVGSFLSVIETPNRLWYYDFHTSLLPFHMWLPDELAFKYARFSERINYREIYQEFNNERLLHFLRRGRGVSYHEFDLTINATDNLNVVSSLSRFLRERFSPSEMEKYKNSLEYEYKNFLMKIGPQNLHEGFYEPNLDLIIKKDA